MKSPRIFTLLLCAAAAFTATLTRAQSVDVVIYGATPGGIAAALAAGKNGRSVLLVEPTIRIGGMATNGLQHPDFRAFEALSGTFWDYNQRTLAYYKTTYGADSQQLKDTFRGTHAEPKVALMLLERMLAEHPTITVKTQWMLLDAYSRGPAGDRTLRAAKFRDDGGKEHFVTAKLFIDGSYEGDLIAAAQVPYRIGVESRDEYGESAAPVDGSGDLQGYNFRFVMTQDPKIRIPVREPKGYRREDFLPLLDLIASGKIKRAFGGYRETDNLVKAQIPILPNNKRDINDVSSGYVRLSLPGEQLLWPEGDPATRQHIYEEHIRWNVGLIYFSQNDSALPEKFRQEAQTWGWCSDEFVETGGIPPQIYVREARRLVGLRVFTQNDTRHAAGDARAVLHRDAIAIGDYGHSSHGVRHEGSRFGGKRFGEGLGVSYAPYQVPYGTIVSKEVRNLLSPVPVSATHVGFCALRLEPVWTALGQAAGHAAHLALEQDNAADVRKVDVATLQSRLHADRSATIYVADVPPDHPDFAAVQWWGALGGLHGLAPKPTGRLLGKQIEGQHSEGWLHHAVELSRPLEPALAARWTELAKTAGVPTNNLGAKEGMTRGDWIRTAFATSQDRR